MMFIYPVTTEKTQHIADLVSNQMDNRHRHTK